MLSRSAGVVATCVLGANAFLIPPHAPGPDHHAGIAPFFSVNPKNQVLELPCSSCAFKAPKGEVEVTKADDAFSIQDGANSFCTSDFIISVDEEMFKFEVRNGEVEVTEADDAFSIQGGANNLILNFTVSEDAQELNLNNIPLYPARAGYKRLSCCSKRAFPWTVNQLPASSSIEELGVDENKGVPLRISAASTKVSKTKIVSANGEEMIYLYFQILGINDRPMTIDEVAIQLLKDENGELLILSVEPVHENMMDHLPIPFGLPLSPSHPLCRFLNAVGEKFEAAKYSSFGKFGGCGGRKDSPHAMPGHIRPHFGAPNADGNRELEGGMPPHLRPHGHHSHHGLHHRHALGHALFMGVVAILIPVMAGIFVGLTVSMIGLLVGKLIGWFWIKFVRRGKRGYASVALYEETADTEADKKDIVYAEALPAYEDAPSYETSGEKEAEQTAA